jgi:FdhE protein
MAPWVRFMAQLAAAQHLAVLKLGSFDGPALAAVEQAVDARMPPLAADGHRRDPAWRDGLALLLDGFDKAPAPAMAEMAKLRARALGAVEALADGFLHGGVDPSDAGAVLFVAAALQVYFTSLAAALPASSLRLLPQRGLCPCCGSTPVSGVVTASGQTPGTRYLYCSLCSTAWNHVRAVCITCGESRSLTVKEIEGGSGSVKAETCDACIATRRCCIKGATWKSTPLRTTLGRSASISWLPRRAGRATPQIRCCSSDRARRS